jgi:hypothetical protein
LNHKVVGCLLFNFLLIIGYFGGGGGVDGVDGGGWC